MASDDSFNTVTIVNNEGSTPPNETQRPLLRIALNVLHTFTNMCIGAITFISIIHAMAWRHAVTDIVTPHLHRLHIYFCVIGYMILISQGAMAFSLNNGWSMGMNMRTKSFAHMGMQITGSIFAIVGSVLNMTDPSTDPTAVLSRSTHGLFGIAAALALTIIAFVLALTNMFCSNMPKPIRMLHSILGRSTIRIAYVSLCLGFNHIYFRAWMSFYNPMINLCIGLTATALFGILIISGITFNSSQQIK